MSQKVILCGKFKELYSIFVIFFVIILCQVAIGIVKITSPHPIQQALNMSREKWSDAQQTWAKILYKDNPKHKEAHKK